MNKEELIQQMFPSTFLRATRNKEKLNEDDLLQGIMDSTVSLYNCVEAACTYNSSLINTLNAKATELATRLIPMMSGYSDAIRLAALTSIIQKLVQQITEDYR